VVITRFLINHTARLLRSFRHWSGRDLIPASGSPEEQARRLYHASFIVISHGTEEDPILNYGNRAALSLWEMSWEEFTNTPSRLTAEPLEQAERAKLLAEVSKKGFMDGYRGVRISRTGRPFRVEKAIVWNLVDEKDRPCGQAATFRQWTYL
jgi:MEKHLA domain